MSACRTPITCFVAAAPWLAAPWLLGSATAAAQSGGSPPSTRPTPLVQAVPTTQLSPATRPSPVFPGSAAPGTADDLTSLSLEDLMNVEVTSVSKKKESIALAPAAVSVITQDDISRSGFSTIPDLLRLAPGTDVARLNSYTWAVGVRGTTDQFTQNLLVLQDGRSVYTPLFGGVFWNSVDYVLEDLDRVEVIRGPGGTLWGANAVHGVINITSKDSRDTQGWLLSTRASNDDSNLSLRYGGVASPDTTYRVYLKTRYDDGLVTADDDRAGDDWSSLRGGFRIDKHPNDATTLTLQGDVQQDRDRVPGVVQTALPPFSQLQTANRDVTSGNILGRITHNNADDSSFQLQAYYSRLQVEGFTENVIDIDFNSRFKATERNEVAWGLGYRLTNNTVTSNSLLTADEPVRNDSIYSAFVQDTLTFQPDRWFFTFGTKLEHNDYTGFELQPSARLLWTPNKQNSVWASVSRAVRTPTRVESDVATSLGTVPTSIGGTTVPVNVTLYGNPDQQAEDLTAYELGYRVEINKAVSIDIAGFYNRFDHLSSINYGTPTAGPTGVVLPAFWGNDISGSTYGGEVSATAKLASNWRLVGSYSLLLSDYQANQSNVSPQFLTTYRTSAPEQQIQLRSYLDITRTLQLNAAVFYVSSVDKYDVPSYVSTTVNVQWKPSDSTDLTVGVLGIFDDRRPEFGANVLATPADEVPLTAFIQFTYRF